MDPRLSVSQVSTWNWTLDQDLAFFESAGIDRVGLSMHKLGGLGETGYADLARRLSDAGITVVSLLQVGAYDLSDPDSWPAQRLEMGQFMDAAIAIRPEVCTITTGTSGGLSWEMAADAFHDVTQGMAAEAEREGLFVCLEPTNPLRADVSFLHTLRDALELGWRCDMGVVMEVTTCWNERNLTGVVEANVRAIGLVHVSDLRLNTRTTPDRLVPGDGDLPLKRIVRHLLDTGYTGTFELELVGPAIEDEGYERAVPRAVQAMVDLFAEIEEDARKAKEEAEAAAAAAEAAGFGSPW